MPGISRLSGNISPQSSRMIWPSTSMQAQFRPISPRPPRKTTRTGSAKVRPEVGQDLPGAVLEPFGSGTHRQAAVATRKSEHAKHRLGGDRVRRVVAGLEEVGLDQLGIDGPSALDVALVEGGDHLGGLLAVPVGGDADAPD